MVLVTDNTNTRRQQTDNSLPERAGRRGLHRTHRSIIAWHVLFLAYHFYVTGCDAHLHPTTDQPSVRWLDLTHTFDETTIYWVTAKKLNFTVVHNGTGPGDKYWYQAEEISAATHGGTHMDAPCHFALGRWCVGDIPPERLATSAAVVDISREVGDDPDVHLTPEHLKGWETEHGRIPDGSLLLVRTGWSRFWPDPLRYTGTTERNASLLKFPSIRPEAARWLIDHRRVVGVGIDVMSVDAPGEIGVSRLTHVTLMEKNVYTLENVNLLHPLPPTGVRVYALPMKLRGASGAPCRILAEVPGGVATGGNVRGSTSGFVSQFWILVAAAAFWWFRRV